MVYCSPFASMDELDESWHTERVDVSDETTPIFAWLYFFFYSFDAQQQPAAALILRCAHLYVADIFMTSKFIGVLKETTTFAIISVALY